MADGKLRIGLGQIECSLGSLSENLDRMAEVTERARTEGVQVLIFPELALSGYHVGNRFADLALRWNSAEMDQLRHLSRQMVLVAGFIEESNDSRFFNSSVCLSNQEILHIHRKVYPPTYGMFDERRFYGAGRDVRAFDTPYGRLAMLICGDCWHLSLPYLAALDGADILMVLAASSDESLSPEISCRKSWERLNQSYALTLSCFVIFVNRAGPEKGLHFWGGSHIVMPNGNIQVQAKINEPDLVVAEINLDLVRKQRIILPFRRDDNLDLTVDIGKRILSKHESFNRSSFLG